MLSLSLSGWERDCCRAQLGNKVSARPEVQMATPSPREPLQEVKPLRPITVGSMGSPQGDMGHRSDVDKAACSFVVSSL